MRSKKLRQIAFVSHRYIGLIVGIVLAIVGLTGSLLVFEHEIDHALLSQQIGHFVPQEQRVPLATAIENVEAAYRDRLEFKEMKIEGAGMVPGEPYSIALALPDDKSLQVYVNPNTGEVMGDRDWEKSFFHYVYELHYQLLAGDWGMYFVGICALLLLVLSITGILLWPGWNKLISGFKIKWNAHPKRTNYDMHKVAGIVAAVFLAMIAFTGFCWNFWEWSEPAIYAATFSPKPP
ncbi:MAG: PepSY domain-containing protein, partial [Microcoleus sp. SIO2G3]|nr:PepSY domain-containing protein [Microcoleus sp. SIO2G3]